MKLLGFVLNCMCDYGKKEKQSSLGEQYINQAVKPPCRQQTYLTKKKKNLLDNHIPQLILNILPQCGM